MKYKYQIHDTFLLIVITQFCNLSWWLC